MTWSLLPDTYFWSILITVLLYSTHQICCAAKDNMPIANSGGDNTAVAVQLFLVRHGETEGNKLGLTLGQSDSVSLLNVHDSTYSVCSLGDLHFLTSESCHFFNRFRVFFNSM
jgi:hypothetical protein